MGERAIQLPPLSAVPRIESPDARARREQREQEAYWSASPSRREVLDLLNRGLGSLAADTDRKLTAVVNWLAEHLPAIAEAIKAAEAQNSDGTAPVDARD